MVFRSQTLIFLLIAALALAGCTIARVESSRRMPVEQRVPAVGVPGPGTPVVNVEKVVTLVPIPQAATPTRTPSPAADSPTPPSFSDFHLTPTRYTDVVSGISFEIPTDWKVTDLTPEQKRAGSMYSISVRSPMPTPKPKQQEGPLPDGASAMDISFWKGEAHNYEEAVALRQKQINESETPVKIASIDEITLGDQKATRFVVDSQVGRTVQVVTYTKNGMLLIAAFGDTTLLDTILASFQIP